MDIKIITLMELPYSDLNKLREIGDVTTIWYSEEENTKETFKETIKELEEPGKKYPFFYADDRKCLVDALMRCIRTTLVVSDESGYCKLETLFSGFTYNYSISDIVLYDD